LKIVAWIFGGIVGLAVVVMLAQGVASESGEVAVLHTLDATGKDVTTRVWVVDHDDAQWLRAGSAESGWYTRLAAQPAIRVERADVIAEYTATPTPEARQIINDLMQDKYGWRDSLIGRMVGGRDGAIPIRLQPRS
jgi:hypothetical protein